MNFEAVGAVLIFSHEPEKLVAFYREVVGITMEEEKHGGASRHWGGRIGSTHFAIHHSRLNRGQSGVAFSLLTRSLADQLEALSGQGITTHRPIDMGNGAQRSTIQDPDGNLISLVQPSETWRSPGA